MLRQVTQNATNQYRITVARNLDEVEAMRQVWRQMQSLQENATPNADIDRYLSVIEAQEGRMKPHVILFSRDGEPAALLVARIEKHKLRCRIGYKVLWAPTLSCLTVVYGGLVGRDDRETADAVIHELQSVLRKGEADMVFFNELRADSTLYCRAREIPGFFCRGHLPNLHVHRSQSMPDNLESFYQKLSKKHRANIRRGVRKLDAEFPSEVRVVKYSKRKEMKELIEAVSEISARTYQHAIGAGFHDNSETRYMVEKASEFGWLRGYVLFVSQKPVAFQLLTRYEKTYFLDKIGYDPEWKSWNVGTILYVKALEDMCGDADTDCIDFLFGDAEYKQSYGDRHWSEASLYIFAPRAYPIIVNLVDSSVRELSHGLARIADKFGFMSKVKTGWREFLRKRQTK